MNKKSPGIAPGFFFAQKRSLLPGYKRDSTSWTFALTQTDFTCFTDFNKKTHSFPR